MRSRASVAGLLLLAGCGGEPPRLPSVPLYADAAPTHAPAAALPPEAGTSAGPSGTAGEGAATGYDAVGYASWYGEEAAGAPTASGQPFAPGAITAAHRTLPLGSYAEVTSLDTGRTILVQITDRGPSRTDREIDLSLGAAQALGTGGQPFAPVRVRSVAPNAADVAALRSGQAASPRLDAPEGLLRALRRQLPASPAASAGARSRRAPASRPAAPSSGYTPSVGAPLEATRFQVQVAAFGSEDRARALAKTLGANVVRDAGIWRVRLGPYDDIASAQRARDGVAKHGYGDASILVAP